MHFFISNYLFGKKSRLMYVMLAAFLLLFTFLGLKDIWTQELRWADIVATMLSTHDFLHPILNGREYYDKPLLSYWMMAGMSTLYGQLTPWVLRLPSALAGMIALVSLYRLGKCLKDKQLGYLAAWMLLTTYYFVFWARISSADMLNLAGTLCATMWYAEKRTQLTLFNYTVFFLILSLTALCKGLVGPVVVFLVIVPDLCSHKKWQHHFKWSLLIGIIPAAVVYLLPFIISNNGNQTTYHTNGLYEVYRENIVRYFHPFDHKDPFYLYFIYLPIYLLPWTFFFIPLLFSLKSHWSRLNANARWMIYSTLVLFVFFTVSGSRRSYYVLPMVPFALLITADWILGDKKRIKWAGILCCISYALLFLNFAGLQPLYYSYRGMATFITQVKKEATQIKPWSAWQVVLLEPMPKLQFYLRGTRQSPLNGSPMRIDKNTLYFSYQKNKSILVKQFSGYKVIENTPEKIGGVTIVAGAPIAFIPE